MYLRFVTMLLSAAIPGRADLIVNGGFENFIIAAPTRTSVDSSDISHH